MKNDSGKLFGWLGGKEFLKKEIIKRIPPHLCYVETCVGGGAVLFEKEKSKSEVINDKLNLLINLYKVVDTAPEEFYLSIQRDLISRTIFDEYKLVTSMDEGLSNVEKAKRFFYILKNSFGGGGSSFAIQTMGKPCFNLHTLKDKIQACRDRLKQVSIENKDLLEVIELYDRPHTFFYIDPPYRVTSSKKYKHTLDDEDYIRLKNLLKGIEGKFLLSLNKDEWIMNQFNDFEIEELPVRYSINKKKHKHTTELLIRNY